MSLIWIFSASILGFAVSSIFAGVLKLPRNLYLLVYIPVVAALFALFIIINKISLNQILMHNWILGVIGAILAGVFVIKNVYSQPSSCCGHDPWKGDYRTGSPTLFRLI